jgi:uncharacterized membrane protein YkoI
MKRILTALAGALAASLFAVQVAPADPPGEPGRHRPNSLGADWRQQQDEARQGVRQRRLIPLGRVIETLRRQTGGRQLDAGLEYEGDRAIYRVRWMTADGRRVDYMIDAATGAILSGH